MVQPIRNQVLFKPFLGDEITKGGIIVPDSIRGESDRGVIMAVGNGTKKTPMYLKAGEIGHRIHKAGVMFEFDGEKYYLLDQSSILATEEN